MSTNNYEQMTSDYNKEDDMVFGKGGSTGIGIDKVKRITKQTQSLKRLLILIGILSVIIILIIILITQSVKLSKLKFLNSQLSYTYDSLKREEDVATEMYNNLNQEKEELTQKKLNLDTEIEKYQNKSSKLNKENAQLVKLEEEFKTINKEVKRLQSINDELKNKIITSEEQEFECNNQIEELNKRVSELKHQLNEDSNTDTKNSNINIESRIIHSTQELEFLYSALPNSRFRLLYRKSRDGFAPKIFHSKCDDASRSIVLLKMNLNELPYVIGGYTSKSWRSSHPKYIIEDSDAFLFHLTNLQLYKVTRPDFAIVCDPNKFPVFYIDLDIGEKEIKSAFPYSYESPQKHKLLLTHGFETLPLTTIEEMEVFEVLKN